jgi:plasmid rolling circle replication initiator protein Rep
MNADSERDSANFYLSDLSPKDKPWDLHKAKSQKLVQMYQGIGYQSLADRIGVCSGHLGFTWELDETTAQLKLRLHSCRFCRCRHCSICQWRRSLMWIARFLKALPNIIQGYPKARYIFLTLTVKNCEISELRQTLDWMNKSWQRMTQRKKFPAIGFARSTEVTRAANDKAHPHFHALLMVEPGYFAGKNYMTQADWTELWKSCLQVDYTPIVNVKAVKSHQKGSKVEDSLQEGSDPLQAISAAIVETFKYSIKPEDLIGKGEQADRDWLGELTRQLAKTRAVALGGVFKNYLSESEPEDLIGEDENAESLPLNEVFFGWREIVEKYEKVDR